MIDPMDDLASAIRAVRFTPVRLRSGYDMSEVDAFLDRLVAAVSAEQDLTALIDAARFTPTNVREGYDDSQVDTFLESFTTRPAAGPAAPGPTPSQAPVPAAYEQVAMPQARPAGDSVVQEVPGLFSRLFKRR